MKKNADTIDNYELDNNVIEHDSVNNDIESVEDAENIRPKKLFTESENIVQLLETVEITPAEENISESLNAASAPEIEPLIVEPIKKRGRGRPRKHGNEKKSEETEQTKQEERDDNVLAAIVGGLITVPVELINAFLCTKYPEHFSKITFTEKQKKEINTAFNLAYPDIEISPKTAFWGALLTPLVMSINKINGK